jgi:PAS domain S-box-containing protein
MKRSQSSGPPDTAIYKQLEAMRQRVQALYRQGGNPSNHDPVLAAAFEELASAMEVMRATNEEHQQQHEEWVNECVRIEQECRRYQELFIYVPAGYLVTSLEGTIRQANVEAAEILQTTDRLLVGRSLALFVPEGQRRPFRAAVERLRQAEQVQEWRMQLEPWKGAPFQASLLVRVARSGRGSPLALHWLLRPVGAEADGVANNGPEVVEQEGTAESAQLVQQQFAFLAEASVLLAVAAQVEATLAYIARLAVPLLADACIITIAEERGGVRQVIVARQPGGDSSPHEIRRHSDSIPLAPIDDTQQGARSYSDLPLERLASDEELRALLELLVPRSAIEAPLLARGQTLGSLTFVLSAERPLAGSNELALVTELAQRIAVVLDRARSAPNDSTY